MQVQDFSKRRIGSRTWAGLDSFQGQTLTKCGRKTSGLVEESRSDESVLRCRRAPEDSGSGRFATKGFSDGKAFGSEIMMCRSQKMLVERRRRN